MPNNRHSHHRPPHSAFKSPNGDITVDEIERKGRAYTIHATKGWRSRNMDRFQKRKLELAWWLRP